MILKLDETIDTLRKWAESKHEVRALLIYGSYAKGEQSEDSDLDIAVFVSDPSGRDDPLTVFVSECNDWTEEISNLFPCLSIHLEWGGSPEIKQALQEAKILVYKAELDNKP